MEATVPVCPLLSTRGGIFELCLGEQCAWYVAPVKKCAFYVLGHQGAMELQKLQRETAGAVAKQAPATSVAENV